MDLSPVTLTGQHIRLEPLLFSHLDGLWQAGSDPAIFRWYVQRIHSREDMAAFIKGALDMQAAGQALPFATVDLRTGLPVGSTRFGSIDHEHHHVEIGWTWLAPGAQRTAANTEAKYLMLRHAFEAWRCIRVEFKTDSLNERSRAALVRLGAREEGTLRNHFICDTGRYRHSVYYSILDSEWPSVRDRLLGALSQERGAAGK